MWKKSSNPISYNGIYFRREGTKTTPILGDKLRDFFLRGSNWDGLTNDATLEEIDAESVARFISRAAKRDRIFDEEEDTWQILKSLNLIVNGKLTNAAVILFGKEPQKYFTNAWCGSLDSRMRSVSLIEELLETCSSRLKKLKKPLKIPSMLNSKSRAN
nr:hypothetical protein [Methanobacterium formicicum]